ncbi:MAG: DUF2515 family protein [Candidatus Berkiellales bacterium]
MKQEAGQIYRYHEKRTEELINSMSNDPLTTNAFITNTYATLSQKHPAFLWFSLGTIVSSKVGQNLNVAGNAVIGSAEQAKFAKVVLKNLSSGNQSIFKDIMPLFLTYESVGIEGIELLSKSNVKTPFKDSLLVKAFKNYSQLQEQQATIAKSLGLPLNDPKVITQLFSDKKNVDLMHSIAMNIAREEQTVVQDMYEQKFVDIIQDPTFSWFGHQATLDEIEILGKTFKFSDYVDDPSDFAQRMNLADKLLQQMENGIGKGEFLKLQDDILKNADCTLWAVNPNTPGIGGDNGIYWGQRADEYDRKVKDSVLVYLNPEQSIQEAITNPIDNNAQNLAPSIFTGEHAIASVHVDPLEFFLATNPNYEVIAHDLLGLMTSKDFKQTPSCARGVCSTILTNTQKPYLKDAYIQIWDNGIHHYYQPKGEVRGITFPFMYDKTTGRPLTKPLLDISSNSYNHASTLETLYDHPEIFSTSGHPNWFNPHWRDVNINNRNQAFKSWVNDRFMNAATQSTKHVDIGIEYNSKNGFASFGSFNGNTKVVKGGKNTNGTLTLKGKDIFHGDSGEINFSKLSGSTSNDGTHGTGDGSHRIKISITGMTLTDGTRLEFNENSKKFECLNCDQHHNTAIQRELETQALLMKQHTEGV